MRTTVPAVLRANPAFRRLFAADAVSVFGTTVSALAFPLLVLSLGGSAVEAGSIATVVLGTRLGFRLPAGWLVDHWNPVPTMVITDLVRLAALGSIPLVSIWMPPHYALLLTVAAVDGVAGAIFGPAAGVVTRDVTTDAQLSEALGLGQAVGAGAALAGPAVGGALFAVHPMLPFGVDALSYAMSALLLIRLPAGGGRSRGEESENGVLAGIRWLFSARPLLAVLLFCGVVNVIGGAMDLIIVVDLRLHGASADAIGLTLSCAGGGAVLGSLLALPLTKRLSVPAILLGLGAVWAAAFAVLALSFTPLTAAAMLTLLMVLSPAAGVVVGTAVLGSTPRHLLGRVNAASSLLIMGLAVLGPVTAGVLVQAVGTGGAWWVLAVATAALTLTAAPTLRGAGALVPSSVPAGAPSGEPEREFEVAAHLAPGTLVPTEPGLDPFAWLEAGDDPDVRAWTHVRDDEFARAAASWSDRERWAAAVRRHEALNSAQSPPRPAGDRAFLVRLVPGQEHPTLIAAEKDGTEKVLVDPGAIDPSGATTLEAWQPSWEGALVAYQLARGGTEDARLYVIDVVTGCVVGQPIEGVRNSSVAWLPGGRGFYYVRRPAPGPYDRRVRLHLIGTDAAEDPVVFGEGRGRTQHYVVRTEPSGRWLTVSASAGTAPGKDVWLADLAAAPPEAPILRGVQLEVDAHTRAYPGADTCYLLTDRDAERGRLARSSPHHPDRWHDLVDEDPEAVLSDFAVLDHPALSRPLLLVTRTRHAVAELTVHDLADGRCLRRLPLPACSSVGPLRALAAGAGEAWFSVSGFAHPTTVYRFDAFTGTVGPCGPSPAPSVPVRQVEYPSADGTTVRMFVVGRLGPRPRPALLTAYGGFGDSLAPGYAPEVAAWVEAGGVYAVASIRGGGEEGRAWHRAGTGPAKQAGIDDLAAAATQLVEQGWTTPERLGVWGASNGGLVTGGAMAQHPDRFGAAVCVAPLLDMAVYQASGRGPSWVAEYGDAADPAQRAAILAYSPYHNVRTDLTYPPTLFVVFDGDSRVDPLHARKMYAALTAVGASALYRRETDAGHGQRSMTSQMTMLSDLLAFFSAHLRDLTDWTSEP